LNGKQSLVELHATVSTRYWRQRLLVFDWPQWYKTEKLTNPHMTNQTPAPVYLNLFRIRFPVGAVASIAHRVSGVCLFLSLPFWIYLLDLSLTGPEGFMQTLGILQSTWTRAGLLLAAWSFFHHLLCGVRFLLLDAGVGCELRQARRSAWFVNITGFIMAFACAGWLF
jgi:succinate dehydrogenase / fumarate reductase cytochrome b subunit